MLFLGNWFLRTWISLEQFQTVGLGLLSYLVVKIINYMTFFSYFPFPSSFFMALWSNLFEIFGKSKWKNNVMGSIFCYAQELRRFLKSFPESPEQIISRATVATSPELFNIFSLYFSIVYFSCSKPFTAHLSFVKNF